MLVLSRKVDEKLVIGDNVVITVSKISGNRVSIAIDAPRDVSIQRGELTSEPVATRSAQQGGTAAASVHVAAHHA
ncbi:carbon storage regulator [Rhodopirellula baltica]|uniref:Translational regulator CsrA n=1 Tax=Rhodopirellula baltica SWK14 TaxID=993516 RepID=L7CNR8_RHOBT|nr:carbon storage regulator [Rhodopirellula baltica]ELP35465.1 Carbon storage regulator [Rhodopirellula baltica SWK14]